MTRKFLSLSVLLSAFLLTFSSLSFAAGANSEDGGEDPTGFIMHHIKDSHEWHFFNIGHTHVTLSLPVIVYSGDRGLEFFNSKDFQNPETHAFGKEYAHEGYYIDSHDHMGRVDGASFTDLSITKNVVMMFLVIAVVLWLALSAAGHYKKHGAVAPKGAAAIVEPIVIFVRDEIAEKAIGPKYKKFVPYLLTLFFFIWVGNLIGLLPGAANLTGNIAVTATLAVLTFIIVNVNGNKDYWKHVFMTPGVPVPLLLVIVPVEIIGLFTKPFALMVRLFVAITAGHIVILAFIALVFIFESYTIGVVSTLMVTFINMIELLVATIQAYVFTLFTAMYIGAAVAEHAHDEAH
ncbi:F0F1 ATP synthase subunit A [Algoriphagus halophytocola]|uniref:ATP synthase subunit a n=1 Tax=Algoriphagus halophytocola TaxID=2991499 RepID=A0ABY6MIC9_9BACT|nr:MULTISPECIES: F0F1 ATP synthase subunit A [unclassified Algoriphagus]UZD21939.1 F0F1 ATP synthase subunit A [Algoriphagus sp. TR-M5]WBL43190.1 F0F1 ATP synthase subunit A [Algoriphagus sp. TR-M9]